MAAALVAASALTLVGQPTSAAEIAYGKGINLGAIGTDNLALVEDPDEFTVVGRVAPFASMDIDFANGSINALGLLDFLTFSDGEREDTLNPKLFLVGQNTLVPKRLFLDTSLAIQNVSDDPREVSADDINTDEDLIPSYRVGIEPYLQFGIGQIADGSIRYVFDRALVPDNDQIGSIVNKAEFEIGNDPAENLLVWDIFSSTGQTVYDDGTGLQSSNAFLSLGYTVSEDWLLSVSGGAERNTVTLPDDLDAASRASSEAALEEINDGEVVPIWDVIAKWRPSSRTTFTFGYGERAFGYRPSVEFERKLSRSKFTLEYVRDFVSTTQQLSDPNLTGLGGVSPSGNDSSGLTAAGAGSLAIEDSLTARLKIDGRRTSLSFEGLYAYRDRIESDATQEVAHLRATLSRNLNSRIELSVSAGHRLRIGEVDEQDYHENRISTNLKINL